MEISLGPWTVTVDGSTVIAADVGAAAARLHDLIAAATANHSFRPVRWRIDGTAGGVLWGQVAIPEPNPGWLRWWIEAISADLQSCAGPDWPAR